MGVLLALTALLALTSSVVAKPHHKHHNKIVYTQAALDDEIHNLPGAPANVPFRQFAGYLNVDPVNNRNLFYWLVESERDPVHDPVSLWTNGGPGCSGLMGFLEEQGPFSPQADNFTLKLNNYAWNRIANMMFIEAPAGVGFSFSDVESDYTVGDARTARDNYYAILEFLHRFPHYANNDFYIASESYGGHYMPTLALAIAQGNNAGVNQHINFKGFAVGNPYNDPVSNGIYGTYPTLWGHSVVSKPSWDAFTQHCITNNDNQCDDAENQLFSEIGDLDPYSLDFDDCLADDLSQRQTLVNYLAHNLPSPNPYRRFSTQHKQMKLLANAATSLPTPSYPFDPCVDDYANVYLNRADVKAAIHANATITWTSCSNNLNYSGADSNTPMQPIYQQLINSTADLKIVVFSGDDDAICPTSGSQYWIYNLGLTQLQPWTQWKVDGQVAGYFVKFRGISLVTIHGAGHQVSSYKPVRGFEFWRQYLDGTWTNN